MSEHPSRVKTFQEDLRNAIAEGRIGRQQLIDKVMSMSTEEIARMPSAATSMLGSDGLAKIARSRIEADVELRDMRAKPQKPIKIEPETSPLVSCQLHPVTRAGLAAIAVLALGFAIDVVRPLSAPWLDSGVRPVLAETWPDCLRLDGYVDGCLYTTGHRGLTLRQAAAMLGMPAADLASANRHLNSHPDNPLPAEAKIIVWRGTLTLEGNHK